MKEILPVPVALAKGYLNTAYFEAYKEAYEAFYEQHNNFDDLWGSVTKIRKRLHFLLEDAKVPKDIIRDLAIKNYQLSSEFRTLVA